ncbi:ATP-dependent RecD-like DNA helicase [Alkalibaculum sp. M08DMB]|uniref:ATP-dependent RecD2 DNA helicase n=1 Tax=Alkalibaculum sporogenes TaxID=2655001 RepID=A0A6A7KA44_9FIRM|nr:ATP-dependent RecD-like DNA helicase [Alkalibaculum sporogenes]MPW26378.1 ATP-dependent RecD-like DNA helicase [Alkalibaculum sporogenes]
MVKIYGYVDKIIFYNESNHYTVMEIECNSKLVTVVGNFPMLKRGEYLSVTGQWVEHSSFGMQLKASHFEVEVPTSTQGMERYLSSGIITGIGEKKAKLLVEHFGDQVIEVIRYNPLKLADVPGIGEKTALSISESFNENREVMESIVYLGTFGITSTYAMRIYKAYKENTISTIKENPYKVIDDVPGMGFKSADTIAMSIGIESEDPFRISAGIKHSLQMCYREGHMFLSEESLIRNGANLLMVDLDLVEYHLRELTLHGEVKLQIIDDQRVYYSMPLFKAEENVANSIISLSNFPYEKERIDIDNIILKFQEENNIELDEIQVEAIKSAVLYGVIIITGGPGTGKTTIINCILDIFKRLNYQVALAAPTGRAAKRMSEATGSKSTTIHRLLEYGFAMGEGNQSFEKNEENPLEYDVIIIDEASMIDILLMNSLLKAVTLGTRIVFVGDINQLPSVGPGNVLKDLIDSNVLEVVKLNKIFRQAQESMIVVNAHRINNGDLPILNEKDKDFFFIESFTGEKIKRKILELCTQRLTKFNFMEDIQIITPVKKGPVGVHELNSALQNSINPPAEDKAEKSIATTVFREGDKIMQIKNNYQKEWDSIEGGEKGKGIFNGDIGFIDKINTEGKKLTATFDYDKRVIYDFEELDEIMHSYAITVHKSQGSEFPVVIMPIFSGPSILLNRNLFYTAVTRAKDMVILVGRKQFLQGLVQNANNIKRNTGLRQRIENNIFIEQGYDD